VYQRSFATLYEVRRRQCLFITSPLTVVRFAILHTFGADDVAIIVAQVLSFGVSVTTLLQVALGGLGRHTEFISEDEFTIAVKV
jgi:hypothetical protein